MHSRVIEKEFVFIFCLRYHHIVASSFMLLISNEDEDLVEHV